MFKNLYTAFNHFIFLKYELVKKKIERFYSYILMSYGHTNMTYKVSVFKSILLLRIYQKQSKPLKHQIIKGSAVERFKVIRLSLFTCHKVIEKLRGLRPGFEGTTFYFLPCWFNGVFFPCLGMGGTTVWENNIQGYLDSFVEFSFVLL